MVAPQAGWLAFGQRLAVYRDNLFQPNIDRGARDGFAVNGDPARVNPLLGLAPRAQSCPRDTFGDSLRL